MASAVDLRASFEAFVARRWRPVLTAAAIMLGLGARLTYGRAMPLWFDETFTGVIAGQATLGGLMHWLLTELTGPLYYAPMWLWARVAGVSTGALRLPSLLCTMAAPLYVLRRGHRDATTRLVWAAILLLWLPFAVLANDARPYALLVLLGTVQAAAFCAVLRAPSRTAALRWVLPTLAMGLTHYVALWPGLVQGVVLLAMHRRAAVALWPAALPFAVLAGWMAVHLPFVIAMASGGAAGSTRFVLADLARLPAVLVGDDRLALLLVVPLCWGIVEQFSRSGWRPGPEAGVGLAGAGAVIGLFAIGCATPGIALRYFLPGVPALLFGAAWVVGSAIRRASMAGPAVLVAMAVAAAGLIVADVGDSAIDQRHAFGTDLPSRWLDERPVRRVVFFWADAADARTLVVDRNLAEVGGFFLRRSGHTVTVEVVHVAPGDDAAAVVAARASATPDTVILWVQNTAVADRLRRPDGLFDDPRWECRDFGQRLAISVGCRRR